MYEGLRSPLQTSVIRSFLFAKAFRPKLKDVEDVDDELLFAATLCMTLGFHPTVALLTNSKWPAPT